MEFKNENVYTGLNMDQIHVGDRGYFSNSIGGLKQQVWDKDPIMGCTGCSGIGYFFSEDNSYSCSIGYPFFYLVERAKKIILMDLEEIFNAVKEDSGFVKYRDERGSYHIYHLDRIDFEDTLPLVVQSDCYSVEDFVNKFTRLNGWEFTKEV